MTKKEKKKKLQMRKVATPSLQQLASIPEKNIDMLKENDLWNSVKGRIKIFPFSVYLILSRTPVKPINVRPMQSCFPNGILYFQMC